MFILGALIAVGAALGFAAVGLLVLWGGWQAFSREIRHGFISGNPAPGQRLLTLALFLVPLAITALFGLLAAGRIVAVALGLG